jgi:hypothetical protein
MFRKSILFFLVIVFLSYTPCVQGQDSQNLAVCLTDSLDGKERKMLAQWVFFNMAAHPEFITYSNISHSSKEEMDKKIGKLLTRLIAEDCPSQTANAIKLKGISAMEQAFHIVGGVAMQELLANQSVSKAFSSFDKYLDQQQINKIWE